MLLNQISVNRKKPVVGVRLFLQLELNDRFGLFPRNNIYETQHFIRGISKKLTKQ